mmetsp:Transcript_87478/g.282626  ORF Transcript_87478/g.282626 Transcript_87478/m.282626 type:complete len:488 (+) Transcript_87478:96-1559(+)
MGTSAMLQSALETTSSSSSSSSLVTGSTTRRRSKQVRRSLSLLASFALPFAVVPASADLRLKLEIPAHFDDHEQVWGSRVLMPLADRLTSEVAALRTELEALRKEKGRFDAASPARWSNPDADHGRTLFLTMCAGSHYFDTYCGPFFASFERAYGASARRHRLVAFVADVDEHLVEAARKRFSPWGQFESLKDGKIDIKGGSDQLFGGKAPGGGTDMFVCKFKEDGTKMCLTDESSKRDEQVAVDSLWFPWRIISYLKEHEADFCYAAVLDSDMLFVRPLGRFLPLCTKDDVAGNLPNGSHVGASWDVAFTAYGPEFRVPWADDAAKVGRTKVLGERPGAAGLPGARRRVLEGLQRWIWPAARHPEGACLRCAAVQAVHPLRRPRRALDKLVARGRVRGLRVGAPSTEERTEAPRTSAAASGGRHRRSHVLAPPDSLPDARLVVAGGWRRSTGASPPAAGSSILRACSEVAAAQCALCSCGDVSIVL